ncbi:MAG: multiheme c-type cytochrome [Mariniblastus sp.]
MKTHNRIRMIPFGQWLTNVTFVLAVVVSSGNLSAQNSRCDPNKVMTAESCAKCHVNEVQTWKKTPHFRTFDELGRRPEAKEICSKLGLRSVKRSDVCIDCHFTTKHINGKNKAVSGVSCESCHGASQDWIAIHNDYGPTGTKETESSAHAAERLSMSSEFGMNNTRNLYDIASNCFNCHTVPNEELVNVGGHKAGTEDFELVRFSQGQVRHNYLRTNGTANAQSEPARLRVMYIVGMMADLEYSTRATARATEKSTFGTKVANRAARTAVKLFEVQQKINDPHVEAALQAFAQAELKINNGESLSQIADQIKSAGQSFSSLADGARLSMIDPLLPNPSEYK